MKNRLKKYFQELHLAQQQHSGNLLPVSKFFGNSGEGKEMAKTAQATKKEDVSELNFSEVIREALQETKEGEKRAKTKDIGEWIIAKHPQLAAKVEHASFGGQVSQQAKKLGFNSLRGGGGSSTTPQLSTAEMFKKLLVMKEMADKNGGVDKLLEQITALELLIEGSSIGELKSNLEMLKAFSGK